MNCVAIYILKTVNKTGNLDGKFTYQNLTSLTTVPKKPAGYSQFFNFFWKLSLDTIFNAERGTADQTFYDELFADWTERLQYALIIASNNVGKAT